MKLKMTRKGENIGTIAEMVGIVLGMIIGWTGGLLLGGLIVHWILTAIAIGNLTYWQIVGLLAIWEIIKPRTESK